LSLLFIAPGYRQCHNISTLLIGESRDVIVVAVWVSIPHSLNRPSTNPSRVQPGDLHLIPLI
jgi:hypothetical protein